MLKLLPLFICGAFYLSFAPSFIQGGDTAELVNSAANLLVPHPPGYPLYVWLYHFGMKLLPYGTLYWKSSIISSLLMVGTIAVLSTFTKHLGGLLLLAALCLHGVVFEAAVLPDVFSLQALIMALMAHAYYSDRRLWLPILFGLGAANHHSIIFLAPVLISGFLKGTKKDYLISLVLGALMGLGLYASLFLLKTDHPYSWGKLDSVGALINHFLRRDYGTLQLAATGQFHGPEVLLYFLKNALLPLMLLPFLFFVSRDKLTKDDKVWASSLALSIAFLFLFNIPAEGVGGETVRRFFLIPYLMSAVLVLRFWPALDLKRALLIGVVAISVKGGAELKSLLSWRHDSVIEDYARNLIRDAQPHAPALIIAPSDSAFFAVRYLLQNEVKAPGVAVATAPLFFHPWFTDKIKRDLPSFDLPNREKIERERHLDLGEDLVRPNLGKVNLLFTKGFNDGAKFRVTFLPSSRLLSSGTGVAFAEGNPERRTLLTTTPEGPQAATREAMYLGYCHRHLAHAAEAAGMNDVTGARSAWEKAIEVVPFCQTAKDYLCQLSPKDYDFCQKAL